MPKFDLKKIDFRDEKEITFRSLEPADAENYIYFSDVIANETTHTSGYPEQSLSVEVLKEKFRGSKNSNWQLDLGGFENERLISHLNFIIPKPQHPFVKHIGIFGIKIIKEFHGIGIGSAMLSIMEDMAKNLNIKRIEATVRTSNHKGISFYRKHRYEIEGLRKKAAFINGVYEDEFYISKFLN